jgi:GT2 family glycosyltransferase
MELQKLDISVITVNYNGWEDTREFIRSWVENVRSVSYEIIVVDNASRTCEADSLTAISPTVKVILNPENSGFAIANNMGTRMAKGRYLFYLNNDLVIKEDHLSQQLRRLDAEQDLAGISPLIRDYHAPYAIQYAGYTPLSRITLRNKGIGIGAQDARNFPAADTAFLHGAAMLLKREAIEKVGLMPEMYFLYYEELDWSSCFIHHGYRLGYDPTCEVFHKDGHTTGSDSPLKSYYMSRNRLIYAYRHRKGVARTLSLLYQICIASAKAIVCYTLKGKPDNARAVRKGINAFIHINPKKSLL